MPRRTDYEIYWEILSYCSSPRSFTSIINRCDLNSKTGGQKHLEFLETKGYVEAMREDTRIIYRSTVKAGEYIDHFTHLYESLSTSLRFKL